MELESKGFGALAVADEAKGEVTAVVATLGVVDRDGDVLLPGSFPAESKVKLSEYGHDTVIKGLSPVGKGIVVVEGDRALFKGHFFMETTRGRDAFHTVKAMGADSEWSFGFPKQVKTAPMTKDWQAKGARRLISGILPLEASPVLVGAGRNTQTLSAKEAADLELKAHRVNCDCGRLLGESPEPLLFVGKAKELSEVMAPFPRDVRHCKSCSRYAVYVPVSTLRSKGAAA